MKKLFILFLILFILPISFAQEELNYNQYKSLDLEIGIGSDLKIIPETSGYSIEYIDVFLTFYPRDTELQFTSDFRTTPEAVEKNEILNYRWNYPTQNELAFYVTSNVNVQGDYTKVRSKIKFPLENIPDQYMIYTKPTNNIDSDNEDIIKMASTIVEGEDDLYIVSFKLAQWIERNIKYSLNTLTADSSQKASWVLTNKEGVCDELTSLYIAMLRSLGIPARYISGVAYTNWNDINDWGPHAWAEVYFPNYGWVPFDLTYIQWGAVDPSHITLKQSLDSNEATTDYEWKGRDVDIETRKLDINVRETSRGSPKQRFVNIDLKPLYPSIGFGSHNIIEIELENLEDFYLPATLHMARIKELKPLDGTKKQVLLKPNENKKVYWVVKLNQDLKRDFIYTIPIVIYTDFLENFSTSFSSTYHDPGYSFNEVKEVVDGLEEEQEKTDSKKIDLSCETEKKGYYLEDKVLLNCRIKNAGNHFLEGVEVCAKDSCERMDLGITQEKSASFSLNFEEPGKKDVQVRAQNKDASKTIYHRLIILDKPNIIINNLKHPAEVEYKEVYNISFSLKKDSISNPLNVDVKLTEKGLSKEWIIEELKATENFVIALRGDELSVNENKFTIQVNYFDSNGNEYEDALEFPVSLVNVTFGQRFVIFFNDIGKWIQSLFS